MLFRPGTIISNSSRPLLASSFTDSTNNDRIQLPDNNSIKSEDNAGVTNEDLDSIIDAVEDRFNILATQLNSSTAPAADIAGTADTDATAAGGGVTTSAPLKAAAASTQITPTAIGTKSVSLPILPFKTTLRTTTTTTTTTTTAGDK